MSPDIVLDDAHSWEIKSPTGSADDTIRRQLRVGSRQSARVVVDVPEDGDVVILADPTRPTTPHESDSDAFAKSLFEWLAHRSPWRLALYSADAAALIAERPAVDAA